MWRYSLIQLSKKRLQLVGILFQVVTFFHGMNAMHLEAPRRPLEIVISDEHGLVERIPTGHQAVEREMSQWVIRELTQQNIELREQLAATKKKWYVITAGVATTVIPLVIVGLEFYNVLNDCEK